MASIRRRRWASRRKMTLLIKATASSSRSCVTQRMLPSVCMAMMTADRMNTMPVTRNAELTPPALMTFPPEKPVTVSTRPHSPAVQRQ